MSETNSNLKRKNEDLDSVPADQLNKRVALDSEQITQVEQQEDNAQTAPKISTDKDDAQQSESEEPAQEPEKQVDEPSTGELNGETKDQEKPTEQEDVNISDSDEPPYDEEPGFDPIAATNPNQTPSAAAAAAAAAAVVAATSSSVPPHEYRSPSGQPTTNYPPTNYPAGNYSAPPSGYSGNSEYQYGSDYNSVPPSAYGQSFSEYDSNSKPVSNHREKESDPTYIAIRMYCQVQEASLIVGKGGEKIRHIREKANVRMDVSENLKNVPERIVTVRGPSEHVARAFGLITRTILDEPEDEPASMMSRLYHLKILVPHPLIGYIIGKLGSKFREIEENSAAKLKAAEQPLPYSTDRVLSVTGVADSIHIAVYYISQVMIDHKDALKKNKILYYNTANFQKTQELPNNGISMIQNPNLRRDMYNRQAMGQQMHPLPPHQSQPPHMPYGQKQPYNFQMMFQPAIHPQQPYDMANPMQPIQQPPMPIPQEAPRTDEHGNTLIGEVIINNPVQVSGNADKFHQDIFVANSNIGSVIGKGGSNIKQIREKSGCTYVKIEPDRGQSIMLGNGHGLTNIRKLTLTGTLESLNLAIYLINLRIATDRERNSH